MWLTPSLLLQGVLLFQGALAEQATFDIEPTKSLTNLPTGEFTTLQHPSFPRHGVRIKKSSICNETVDSYTGYIDFEARHLFFYFFESRNDPDSDDVVFWTTGGPGGSSAISLFMEHGPCRITDSKEGPKFHSESWNSNANIFFVDQPVGTGFSYADYGEVVSTTEEAAKDVAAFISIFFEHFSQFKGRPFHMSGSSYGGRYIPIFASAVYDQNVELVEAGLTPINLTSILIGNGMTDVFSMLPAYYKMACTSESHTPVLSISTCVRMKQVLPRCEKWAKSSCIDTFNSINCAASLSFCESEIIVPFLMTGLNPYDVTEMCAGEPACYPVMSEIEGYLNRADVQAKLGVDPSFQGKFEIISGKVEQDFVSKLDHVHQTQHYVAALLERGIKALIYVGTDDWICNHIGNERWTLDMEWSGQDEFSNQDLQEWSVNGTVAGVTRSASGLTYATINNAGHMASYNRPKESLELLKRWMVQEKL